MAERDPQNGAPLPPHQHRKKETPSPITDRFYIEGIFYPYSIHTGLRLDPTTVTPGTPTMGTTVSGERDLGLLPKQYQGRVEAMMRIRERSKVRFDFEDVNRSASQVLSRNVQFGNETFPQGYQADTSINWRMATVTYTYSLYRSDTLEVGVGAALHAVQARVTGDVQLLKEFQSSSVAGFLPTIPVEVTWRFAPRFSLVARADYFRATVSSVEGSLLNLHGDVQYRWTPNFAVGVGYTLERLATQLSDSSFSGAFSLDMRGEEAFFRVSL
jgi:hypothetical protein